MNLSSPPLLRIDALRFAYPDQPALVSNWSASIGPGVTLLYGDTGTGKSALLQVIAGTLPATEAADGGGGEPRCRARGLSPPGVLRRSGDRPLRPAHARECTASLVEGDAGFSDAKWQAIADGFALAPHLDKKMFMLSTGSKRKVWMAAGLASGRPLILLDEPTAGLDAPSTRCLWATLTGFSDAVGAGGHRGQRGAHRHGAARGHHRVAAGLKRSLQAASKFVLRLTASRPPCP